MTSLRLVDDTDPQVLYSGGWISGGVAQEFNQTTHGTYGGGSQVRFTFNGSSVAVYGTISNELGSAPIVASISTYSIDGSRNVIFDPPIPSAVQYRQPLYQSPILENTQHVLIITSLVSGSAFWLDYFEVGTASTPPSSTSTPLTSTGISLPSTTPSTNYPQPSSTEGPQPPASFSASSSPRGTPISKGVVAGAVIGSLVIVALMGIVIWLIFRRRVLQKSPSDADSIEAFGSTDPDRTRPPPGSQVNPSMHSISSSVAVDHWSPGPPFTGSPNVYGEQQGLITMTASPSGNAVYGFGPASSNENHGQTNGQTNESFTQVVYQQNEKSMPSRIIHVLDIPPAYAGPS